MKTRILEPITRQFEYSKIWPKVRVPGYSMLDNGITSNHYMQFTLLSKIAILNLEKIVRYYENTNPQKALVRL